MPIPGYTIDGVLPPFVGPSGSGGAPEDMTPYAVTAIEVVTTLGQTEKRKTILRGWLRHRQGLRAAGFDRGFQWLDGSFVEDKDPNDLDIVSFTYRPADIRDFNQLVNHMKANISLFDRAQAKAQFKLDAFAIDLDGTPEGIVNLTRYWLGLFSHRRGDHLWKGMLQVRLEDIADDTAAGAALGPEPFPLPGGGVNP